MAHFGTFPSKGKGKVDFFILTSYAALALLMLAWIAFLGWLVLKAASLM